MARQRLSSLMLTLLLAGGLCTSCGPVSGPIGDTSTPPARPPATNAPTTPQWRVVARFQGNGQEGFDPNPQEDDFTVDVPIGDWKIVWTCDASHVNKDSDSGTGSSIFALNVFAYGARLEDDIRWFSGGGVSGNCGHPVTLNSAAWALGLQQIPTSGTLGPWTAADFGLGDDLRDLCYQSRPDQTCAIDYSLARVPWSATVMEYR